MKALFVLWTFVASSLIAAALFAAGGQPDKQSAFVEREMAILDQLTLTAAQKAQIAALKKSYGPKLRKAEKNHRPEPGLEEGFDVNIRDVLTPEQKQKFLDIKQKQAGSPPTQHLPPPDAAMARRFRTPASWGHKRFDAVGRESDTFLDGVNLTDAQQAKVTELEKEYASRMDEARTKSREAESNMIKAGRVLRSSDTPEARAYDALTAEFKQKLAAVLTPEQLQGSREREAANLRAQRAATVVSRPVTGRPPRNALDSGSAAKTPATRTWTSADGKFHIQAALVETGTDSLILKKDTGDTVTVPRQKLSAADRDYLDQQAGGSPAAVHAENWAAAVSVKPTAPDLKAAASNVATLREFCRFRLDFNTRLTRAAYQRKGKKSPAGDDAALQFLDATTLVESYGSANPILGGRTPRPVAELRALGEALRKAGCDDPLVLARYLGTLPRKSLRDPQTEIKPALEMLETLQGRHYPPLLVAAAARDVRRACDLSRESQTSVDKVLADQVLVALSAKEFPGTYRQIVLVAAEELLTSLPVVQRVNFDRQTHLGSMQPGSPNEFYDRLRASKDVDPWLAAMILARTAINTGLQMSRPTHSHQYMGQPFAIVSPADPGEKWAEARRYLAEALKLHPECPQAAAGMLFLAVQKGDKAEIQLWFERAVAAQFDYIPAYTAMRKHLLDAGDMEAVYSYGQKCLRTGRFDTTAPYQLVYALKDIEAATHSQAFWQRAGVYDDLRKMFRGYMQDAHDKDKPVFYADVACCAYLAGHLDDARRALERAGDAPDLKTIESYGIDAKSLIGRLK